MTRALALCICAAALGQDTRVVLLGTGNPNPEPGRMGPAVAVVSGDGVYVVDCGPGVVRRAAEAGIGMRQLTRLFVTHLHSDHTAGLPDFVFTPAVTGRDAPLDAYGPPGLRRMVSHVMEAWREDMDIRLRGLEPAEPRGYVVRAHDVKPGEIHRDANVKVIAIAVNHGQWRHAYGYRFEAKDKTIVVSGDTTRSAGLLKAARGADILVHEVYSRKGWEKRAPEWRRYHAAYHTSAPDLGALAAEAGVRTLVLYHQLPMGETPEQLTGEAAAGFQGRIVYGRDLDVIR